MWWLRRSMRITSASDRPSARAAAMPAKPAPTMTTRFRPPRPSAARGKVALSGSREASTGGVPTSCNALFIVLPLLAPCALVEKPRASALEPPSSRRGRALDLLAQFEQAQQDLVALGLELGDCARAHLLVEPGGELVPHRWRQFGRAEHLPPGGHGGCEL